MTFREALRGLRDNPLYRLESRHTRVGLSRTIRWGDSAAGEALLIIGIVMALGCGCSPALAVLIAPTLAAIAVVRAKRGGIWQDILLTALTPEEILLGKLVPALRLPALLALIAAGLSGVLGYAAVGVPGAWFTAARLGAGLAAALGALLVTGSVIIATGLLGLLCGLRYAEQSSAVMAAVLGTLLLEGVIGIGSLLMVIGTGMAVGADPATIPRDLYAYQVLSVLMVTGANGGVAAALWIACAGAVRRSG